jgi:hypothetical protein
MQFDGFTGVLLQNAENGLSGQAGTHSGDNKSEQE